MLDSNSAHKKQQKNIFRHALLINSTPNTDLEDYGMTSATEKLNTSIVKSPRKINTQQKDESDSGNAKLYLIILKFFMKT